MNKLISLNIVLLMLVALGGCAVKPKPVYQLHALNGSDTWLNGREIVSDKQDGLDMAMTFDSVTREGMAFQVEFANESEEKLTIDPAYFYYALNDSIANHPNAQKQQIYRHGCVVAVDPEKALLNQDMARSRNVAAYQSRLASDSLFDLISIATDIASSDKNLTEEQKQTKLLEEQKFDDEEYRRRLSAERRHSDNMRSLSANQYRWSKENLRKTTLMPGQCIGGRVVFPMKSGYKTLFLRFPINGRLLKAQYSIEEYLVKPRSYRKQEPIRI